jgi:hypothetical protein
VAAIATIYKSSIEPKDISESCSQCLVRNFGNKKAGGGVSAVTPVKNYAPPAIEGHSDTDSMLKIYEKIFRRP